MPRGEGMSKVIHGPLLFEAGWIDQANRIVADVSIKIRAAVQADRIFVDEPASLRIIETRPVVHQPRIRITFAPAVGIAGAAAGRVVAKRVVTDLLHDVRGRVSSTLDPR